MCVRVCVCVCVCRREREREEGTDIISINYALCDCRLLFP